MLTRLGVTNVHQCHDGADAVTYLESITDAALLPNLIMSDINMPNMDGPALMAWLREYNRFTTPPTVVVCSGKLKLSPVVAWLVKPITSF